MSDFLEQSVDILKLGTKELHALRLLKVESIKDFIKLKLNSDLMPRGYGYFTYKSLQKTQKKLLKKQHILVQKTNRDKTQIFSEILNRVNVRTQHCLRRLGVITLQGFLELTDEDVLGCKGAGQKVLSEIKMIQNDYIHLRSFDSNSFLSTPANHEIFKNLPLFSSKPLPITDVELNSSYFPYLKVEQIQLPDWTSQYLKQMNIKTFGELLLTPGEEFLQLSGFGTNKLHELKQAAYLFLSCNIEQKGAKDKKEIFKDVIQTMSVRTQNILKRLEVNTTKELLFLTDQEIIHCKGAGYKVLSEIKLFQKKYRHLKSIPLVDCLRSPANKENIKFLPLFSNEPLAENNIDLHPSYLPIKKLSEIMFPSRATKLFKNLKIRTIGELLLTPPQTFIDQDNVGIITIKQIREKIENCILNNQNHINIFNKSFSSTDLLKNFTQTALTTRERKVILLRAGVFDSVNTLEQIAKHLRLTRERIRQIQSKAEKKLRHPSNIKLLNKLQNNIEQIIKYSGGRILLSELAKKLDYELSWDKPSKISVIDFIISLFGNMKTDNEIVYLDDFPCRYCNAAKDAIENKMRLSFEVNIKDISDKTKEFCSSQDCKLFDQEKTNFSCIFIKHYIANRPKLRKLYSCHNNLICKAELKCLKYGPKHLAVEQILKDSRKPLHFTEITSIYKDYRPEEKVSDQSIYGILGNLNKAVLWDRGTFIHYDYILFDTEFTDDVSDWLFLNLRNGLSFISISGAYSTFKKRCKKLNIKSEMALYSYLRLERPKKLFLNKYPFITRTNRKISVQDFLVDYVKARDGEIPLNELKEHLKTYGFKNHLGNMLRNVPSLLIADNNKIIHVDNLNITSPRFYKICKYAQSLLLNSNIISVQKVYKDKMISCKLLGINGPRLLFSCFQNFGQQFIITGRYPQLKSLDKKHLKGLGIRTEFEDYLKKHGTCSKEGLIEHFVEKMGYSEGSIEAAVYYLDDILLYTPNCYINRTNLGWSQKQYNKLLQILREAYFESSKKGKYYARLKDIYDYWYVKLPEIQSDIPWTFTLLRSLTESIEDFRFLGNAKDAYIALNSNNQIKTLQDLIHMLLYQEYDGAAKKDDLEKQLVSEGILRKHLTPNMLNDSDKIVINGNNVIAKELVQNV